MWQITKHISNCLLSVCVCVCVCVCVVIYRDAVGGGEYIEGAHTHTHTHTRDTRAMDAMNFHRGRECSYLVKKEYIKTEESDMLKQTERETKKTTY